MARVVVGSLHVLIALLLAWACGAWVIQILLNATWERGFYGEISVLTSAATLAVVMVGTFATFEAVAAIGWFFARPAAGWALVFLSVMLAVALPGPLRVLLAMSAASIGLELWARARAEMPPDPDEDSD